MANAILKTDFKNGDKLYDHDLNNNFKAIEAALGAMNKIVWQDSSTGTAVLLFKGNGQAIEDRELADGQLLYNINTGETYIDTYVDGVLKRINTGSGNVVAIQAEEPTNEATTLWIEDETIDTLASELTDNHTNSDVLGYKASFLNDKLIHVGTSVDEDYRVNVLFSKELYNPTTITNGIGISDTNGATYVDNNLFTTDYIDISGASDICWYGSANASGVGLWGAFYNSSKQYVSGITTSNNTIAVPDNAKYARLSMRKTYTNSASIQKGISIITPSINVDNEEIYKQGQNEVYSTSERIIGTWIDGKPLYRKVIDCGALPNNATKAINHNVTNVNYMVKVEGTAWNPTIKNAFPLNLSRPSSPTGAIGLWYDETQIKIETATDRSAWTKTYVILEYTKTTD
jgi:hypothetical protein